MQGPGKGGDLSLVLIVQATLQRRCAVYGPCIFELELELIQTHIAQKPVLRVEVGARALRVRYIASQAKSRSTLRDTWSKRQGGYKPRHKPELC